MGVRKSTLFCVGKELSLLSAAESWQTFKSHVNRVDREVYCQEQECLTDSIIEANQGRHRMWSLGLAGESTCGTSHILHARHYNGSVQFQ